MKRLIPAVAVVAALAGSDAVAFSFLCNGIDANGNPSGDNCGACSANSAARWDELQVDFRFDDNTRPPEESLSEWQSHQTATLSGWGNVQGHSLTLRDTGAASFRSFGSVNGENSIFWITNRTEFQNQVRSSPNSILGVTLAPYNCGGGGGRRGGILDADIVMNGTGVFNWDQNSVVSTMTHEVGHAIGFGHPCTDCSNVALMSATSGFNESDTPLFDDQEAIRALYPGTPGGLGTACSNDGNCTSGPCITVSINGTDRSFCSQSCNGSCPDGLVCADVAGEGNVCVFSNAGIADPGDACGPPGCADECTPGTVAPGCNVCLEDGNASTCFAGCNPGNGAGCSGTDVCAAFGCSSSPQCGTGGVCSNGACVNSGVCVQGGTALRGQSCSDDVQCVQGVTCITDQNGNNGVCLGLCDGAGAGCLSTESCLYLFSGETNLGACFTAGAGVEGDRCNEFEDCGRGLICLGGECAQRCDRGFSCGGGQTCTAIPQGNGMQFCSPVGGEGEGEGEGEREGEGAECSEARGNFDCPAGQSCDDGDCVVGGEGPNATFTLCDGDADCSGGLCVNGVCTRPCDVADGCPAAYTCEADICVPDSCLDNADVCGPEFTCTYSSAQRNVCAKGVAGGICNCTSTGGEPASAWVGVASLLGLGIILRRRRRL